MVAIVSCVRACSVAQRGPAPLSDVLLLLMGAQALGCAVSAPVVRLTGSVALLPMDSSRTRDLTHVPSIGRWILNHWTPQESPRQLFCKVVGHLGWSCFLKIQFAFIWTHSFRFRYIYLPIKSCGPQAETDGH